jgi:IPTL-CTERM motif
MRHLRCYVIALLLVAAPDALAQTLCVGGPTDIANPTYLYFNPRLPSSAQTVAISVGTYGFVPGYPLTNETPPQVALQGNNINVTVDGQYINSATQSVICATAVIGPLTPGTYTVKFFVNNTALSQPSPPALVGTAPLTVLDNSGFAVIPTVSPASLAALASLLALMACYCIRRRARVEAKPVPTVYVSPHFERCIRDKQQVNAERYPCTAVSQLGIDASRYLRSWRSSRSEQAHRQRCAQGRR